MSTTKGIVLAPALAGGRRLGLQRATQARHAVPRLRRLTMGLGTPPAAISWATGLTGLDMLGNDQVGDCAIVGPANLARVATSACGHERIPLLAPVLQSYAEVSGWRKDDPATDTGCVMTNVLERWKGVGLDFFGDGTKDRIEGYLALNPKDTDELKWAICWFGGVLFGFDLPVLCQDDKADWAVPPPGPQQAIWGGHCTAASSYGLEGFHEMTWATFKRTTDDFVRTYAAEAYVVVMKDWEMPSGLTPAGTSRVQMQDQIRRLASAASAGGVA